MLHTCIVSRTPLARLVSCNEKEGKALLHKYTPTKNVHVSAHCFKKNAKIVIDKPLNPRWQYPSTVQMTCWKYWCLNNNTSEVLCISSTLTS